MPIDSVNANASARLCQWTREQTHQDASNQAVYEAVASDPDVPTYHLYESHQQSFTTAKRLRCVRRWLSQPQRSASAQSVQFAANTLGRTCAVSSVCRNCPRVRARSQLSLQSSPSGESAQSAQFATISLGCARADAQSVQS